MKKLLSTLLCLTLVLGSMTCIFVGSASAATSVWGTEPLSRYEINYDDAFTGHITSGVTSAEGHDDTTSRMLYVPEDRDSTTALNYSTIITKPDTDAVYTFPVKEGTYYRLSWWLKINPFTTENFAEADDFWYAFYLSYNGNNKCGTTSGKNGMLWKRNGSGIEYLNLTSAAQSATGTWTYYETYVTTAEAQDKLSLYYNLGTDTPETFIDDIVLEEVSYFENPANWGQTSGKTYTIGDGVLTSGTQFTLVSDANYVNGSSLAIKAAPTWSKSIGIKLKDIKPNTTYSVSFDHKVLNANKVNSTATFYKFFGLGVYTKGEELAHSDAFAVITGTALSSKFSSPQFAFDTWNTTSFKFTTGQDTDAYFITQLYANVVYIDNLEIEEITYYDAAANWGQTSGRTFTVGADFLTLSKGMSNVTNADLVNDSIDSVLIDTSWGNSFGIKLQNLKKNTVYRVDLDHKVTTTYAVNANTNYYKLFGMGVYTAGDKTVYNNSTFAVITGTSLSGDKTTGQLKFGVWNKSSFEFTVKNDTDAYFVASPYANGIYVDNFTVTEIETGLTTAYNNAAALRSATASSTGKNGLRVYNEIKKSWMESASIVEYGSVATRASKIGDASLTVDNGVKGVAFSDGTVSEEVAAKLWDTNDTANVFTSYLVNIPVKYYGEDYIVRSYAIDKDGNVCYGEVVSICVFQMANAIDLGNTVDGSAVSEDDKSAFYAFVNSDNYQAYSQWCTNNSLTVGDLYNARYAGQ